MRGLKYIFITFLIVYFGLNIFIHRSELFSKFDEDYWRVKYEQSQWLLPLSWRIIGDDGLYLYEGFKIIHGHDPTLVNAEVPPLPKYLIGLSILIFGNGHWYGVYFTVGSAVLFYFLTRRLLGKNFYAQALTILFILDPLLTEQFPLTMVDSAQLFFLLLYFLLLVRLNDDWTQRHKIFAICVAGIVLGLFSSTRYPVLTPFLAVFGLSVIWKYYKKINFLLLFIFSITVSYLIPYTRYFLLGHNLIDWLGVQKWIYNFYRSSRLEANIGSFWTTIIANRYQNLFTKVYEPVPQWSFVWPVITITSIFGYIKAFRSQHIDKKIQDFWKIIGMSLLVISLFYSVVPFWTRYLLLTLPLSYLGLGYTLRNSKPRVVFFVIGVLSIINIFATSRILFPTPEVTVRQFLYAFENGFFQDMYENVSQSTKNQISRDSFSSKGFSILRDAQIEKIQIADANLTWSRFISPQYLPLRITYMTRYLGPFTNEVLLPVIYEDNRWRIDWNWQFFISDLPDDATFETTVYPARRGSIIGSDNKVKVSDFQSFMIWITPASVDHSREDEMLTVLENLFSGRIPKSFLHHRYIFNTDSSFPVALGVIPDPINKSTKSQLLSFPGITLTPSLGRYNIFYYGQKIEGHVENAYFLECCSRLYSTTNYSGASGIEKEKNQILKGVNGGNLVIKDNNGKIIKVLIESEKRDGTNVTL